MSPVFHEKCQPILNYVHATHYVVFTVDNSTTIKRIFMYSSDQKTLLVNQTAVSLFLNEGNLYPDNMAS